MEAEKNARKENQAYVGDAQQELREYMTMMKRMKEELEEAKQGNFDGSTGKVKKRLLK